MRKLEFSEPKTDDRDQRPCDSFLPLSAAIERVTGHRPSPSTCHRWRLRGVRGVKLRTFLIGGRRVTTEAAVREFVASTTAAGDASNSGPPASSPRISRIETAERELDDLMR